MWTVGQILGQVLCNASNDSAAPGEQKPAASLVSTGLRALLSQMMFPRPATRPSASPRVLESSPSEVQGAAAGDRIA